MLTPPPKHAALLLAAGGSKRLGHPKQLLDWQGQPLVCHIARLLLDTQPERLMIVTGSRRAAVIQALSELEGTWEEAFNPNWESGMASSLQTGLRNLPQAVPPHIWNRPVLVAATDQPFVTTAHFNALLKAARLPNGAWQDVLTGYSTPDVASGNKDKKRGIPACLSPSTLLRASELSGDEGFRKIWRVAPKIVQAPEMALDIDTPEDWKAACIRVRQLSN